MTKPIILVKVYAINYCMSFKELKRSLISDFLASAHIEIFGRTYLFVMRLPIGFTLFYTQGIFV